MGILSILHSILSFTPSFLGGLWNLAFSIIHEISPLRFKSVHFSYDNGSLTFTIEKLSLHLLQSKQPLIEIRRLSLCVDIKFTIISFLPFVSISHNPYEQRLSQRKLIITHIKLDSVIISLRKSLYDSIGILDIWRFFNAKTAVDDGIAFERYIQSHVMNHLLPTMPEQPYIPDIQSTPVNSELIKGPGSVDMQPTTSSWLNYVVQEFVVTRLTIQFYHSSTVRIKHLTKPQHSSRLFIKSGSSPTSSAAPEVILQANKMTIIRSELYPGRAVASHPIQHPSHYIRAHPCSTSTRRRKKKHTHVIDKHQKLKLHKHLPSILRLISHTRHQCHKHKQVVSTPPRPRPSPHPSVAAADDPGLPLHETIWRLTALVFKRLFDKEPGKVMRLLSLTSVQRGLK